MGRKSKEELSELCIKFNTNTLWSWSRYNAYRGDAYGYYLRYILKAKPDRNDGIYGTSGGTAHDCLEEFYEGKKNKKGEYEKIDHLGMLEKYESALMEFDLAGLKYDRTDEEKNKSIANKYESCLRHFFLHHQQIPHKVLIEKFITAKVGNYYFQGYIDALHKEIRNDEPTIVITDWKTSSIYKGEKIDEEKGQLVLYAEAMRQKVKCPIENIVIRWNFLKYVEIEYTESKGNKKTRIVERNNIGSSLKANSKMWLKKDGYDEFEIDDFIVKMISMDSDYTNNSIEVLPQSVQDRYKISDCYVEIPLNEEIINELKQNIITALDEIVYKTNEYNKTKDENLFWQDVTKKSSYFLANLSDYSAKYHKPYAKYLDELKLFEFKEDENGEEDTSDLDWLFN